MESFEGLGRVGGGAAVAAAGCFIDVVNLADLQEVVYEEAVWTHEAHHAGLNEFTLLNIPTVELKIEFLSEVLLNVLDVAEVAET